MNAEIVQDSLDIMTASSAQEEHEKQEENRQKQQIISEKFVKSYGDESEKFVKSYGDEKINEEEELDMDECIEESDINPSDILKQTMHAQSDLEVRFFKEIFFIILKRIMENVRKIPSLCRLVCLNVSGIPVTLCLTM